MKDFHEIPFILIVAKVYNRMLLNLIYDPIDKLLRPYQAGFRKNRDCLEKTHVIH